MFFHLRQAVITAGLAIVLSGSSALAMDQPHLYYAQFSHGPSSSPDFFPIVVWLQSPGNADAYQAAGVNLFVGLWNGPTEGQLSTLSTAGMQTMCDQNAVGLAHVSDTTITGWTQGDEPDNAQPDGMGGWGPPIDPSVIIANRTAMRAADSTRPVYLNLGQGVAWDNWYGRGVRTNHPEDYIEYVKGADIVSFDIYPVNSADAEVTGNLWFVAQGIDRLKTCVNNAKPVWCWIECTKIDATSAAKPTPAQVRSEVWMALIHGANGIGYFCHVIGPVFDEPGLLHDATMLAAVTALNQQISNLAAVLNSLNITGEVTVSSSNGAVPIDIMVKHHGGFTYVFAVAMRDGTTTGTFTLPDPAMADVIDESRQISAVTSSFSDNFTSYGVHLYKVSYDYTAPTVNVNTATLTGTVSDLNTCPVEIVVNGTHLPVNVTGLNGTWHADDLPLPTATTTFTITATDASANTRTVTLSVAK